MTPTRQMIVDRIMKDGFTYGEATRMVTNILERMDRGFDPDNCIRIAIEDALAERSRRGQQDLREGRPKLRAGLFEIAKAKTLNKGR